MSRSKDIFDNLSAEDIRRMISDHEVETVHLEFKKWNGDSSDDRKNLAKEVSAFANADGGVIVWGVETQHDSTVDADVAHAEAMVETEVCRNWLEHRTGDAVDPPADGVEHRSLVVSGDRGFVATHIPASDATPHMAKYRENRYYKRNGTSAHKMEHYDLEDMFGRRKRPALFCDIHRRREWAEATEVNDHLKYEGKLWFRIRNTGRAIASHLQVELRTSKPGQIEESVDGRPGVLRARPLPPVERWHVFCAPAGVVLHLDETVDVATIGVAGYVDRMSEMPDLVIEYRVYAEGIRPVSDQIVLSGREVWERWLPRNIPD